MTTQTKTNRYFQGILRCEDDCLFGRDEKDCLQNIMVIHPTLSKDVYGHATMGVVAITETQGSCGPVIGRIIGQYSRGPKPTHPFQLLWCVIYFDNNVGYYRPKFLTKDGVKAILKKPTE